MYFLLIFSLCFLSALASEPDLSYFASSCSELDDLTIDLKNPSFSNGVLSTEEGGVAKANGLRIQARKMTYINKTENGIFIQKVLAEDDLMLELGNRVFVGSQLEYDFIHRRGTVICGKTFVDMWFLGGDKIELLEDGTFSITNAFVTTCENQDTDWDLQANTATITKNHLLSAKNIHFRIFKVPLFWLPVFKSNLKALQDSPIRYKVVWDKILGPRLTARYRFFSWKDIDCFFRLDYRIKRGFGAALETEYLSQDKRTIFVTRSYGAHDKSFPDEKGPHRYRLQGLYHYLSEDQKTQVHLTYDKLSDSQMVGDFKSEDFEINTQQRTLLTISREFNQAFLNFNLQPRINPFQSIDQELPFFFLGIRPFTLGSSRIISINNFNGGFLDYVYTNPLRSRLDALHLPAQTRAGRVQAYHELYRPFSIGPLMVTPNIGATGIFYSNNSSDQMVIQATAFYGLEAYTRLVASYSCMRHVIEPYAHAQGYTRPVLGLNKHFYFDIDDGYTQLNQLRIGIRNDIIQPITSHFAPTFTSDIYTYGFFGKRAFDRNFPKGYLSLGCNFSSIALKTTIARNFENQVWDFVNVSAEWTLNEDLALAAEFRHRSAFDWRKANHKSFLLDVARPISELLDTSLSDRRNTILARGYLRLGPKWSCLVQTKHGWGRRSEPSYHAGKIDLFTMLTCSWQLRLSYERLPNDNRFTAAVSLFK
ncbi:MAG TPA: hypothetical protein VGZ69_04155 [Candidatus Rhabdochlamydia sp.]|jgi:hypothetical protein|nr:hypothetical protein [Candidatus Rhabdochlamydia sp.]